MKNLILTTVTAVLLLVSCDSGTIGKYKKEPLPDNFSYNVIEDKSNVALEKNQLESKAQVADLLNRIYEDYPDHATLSEARKTIEISKEMQENSAKEAKAQLDAAKTEAQEIIQQRLNRLID